MENKKFTKRAIVTSIIAVLMCCTLLVGGTFAWFTDTATTGINTIESGNLDIELYYATYAAMEDGTIADNEWQPVSPDKAVFNQEALWEPGYTEVVYFKMANVGNLSLKYRTGVDIFNEKSSINKYGEEFKLSDYICAYRMDGDKVWEFSGRENAQNPYAGWPMAKFEGTPLSVAVEGGFYGEDENATSNSLNAFKWLEPGESAYTTLVLWMPEEVGNEANYLTGKDAPWVQLGVNVTATQYNWEDHEFDSFDHNYDADAEYEDVKIPGYIYTEEELVEAIAKGGSYKLGKDIELTDDVTVVTADTVLDLNGHKIEASRDLSNGNTTELVSTLTVDSASLTINGSGTVKNAADEGVYALGLTNGANVIVNGGTFESYHDAVYIKTGTLTINGGVFNATADTNPEPETNGRHDPNPINCHNDNLLAETAKVIMRGGALVNCDPSNIWESWGYFEGSYVAAGYRVETEKISDTYVLFNVVKD